MREFVKQRNEDGLPHGLRLKANRSKEERARRAKIHGGFEQLKTKGFDESVLKFSRNRFWQITQDGSAVELGVLQDGNIVWGRASGL